jgi:hypothetical protein
MAKAGDPSKGRKTPAKGKPKPKASKEGNPFSKPQMQQVSRARKRS